MAITNNELKRYETFSYILSCISGVILHFAYNWSNKNFVIGLFTPVNESSFEHLKLMFFPFMLFGAVLAIKLTRDKFNIYFAKIIGILIGMSATLFMFYVVNFGFKETPAWFNIVTYFIGMLVAHVVSYHIIKFSAGRGLPNGIAFACMFLMGALLIVLTIYTPRYQFFQDPLTLRFGIFNSP